MSDSPKMLHPQRKEMFRVPMSSDQKSYLTIEKWNIFADAQQESTTSLSFVMVIDGETKMAFLATKEVAQRLADTIAKNFPNDKLSTELRDTHRE